MNKLEDITFSKELAWKLDVLLLMIHICLMVFFIVMHITLMAVVNVFSVCIYSVMVWVSQRRSYLFLMIAYYEILLHMILAIICVGWDFGFQFYCFFLIPVIFFCDYLNQSNYGRTSHPVLSSFMVIASFLGLRAYTWFFGALYPMDSTVVILFSNMMNALFSFGFLIFYMANYESLTILTEHVATKDELTGLNNRHKMRDMMQVVLQQRKQGIAIAMLDIDDFKKINDTFGHNVGDMVLKAVAQRIENLQNNNIHVCRWGGEEFLIMASGNSSYTELREAIQKLIQELGKSPVLCDKTRISVTVTAGVSCKEESENIDQTISRADKYLYEGKLSGKNKMVARDEMSKKL